MGSKKERPGTDGKERTGIWRVTAQETVRKQSSIPSHHLYPRLACLHFLPPPNWSITVAARDQPKVVKECELLRVYSSWRASLLLLEAHSFPRAHTSYPVTLHVLAFYCWFVASWSEDGCHGSRNHDLLDPLCFLPSFKGTQIYFSQTSTLIKTWSHSPPAFKTGTAT